MSSLNSFPVSPITEKALTCSGACPLESPNNEPYLFNSPRLHQAVIPAVNGITNAHTLARIYALLIGDVNENGTKKACLLSKKTLALATENVTPAGEDDQVLIDSYSNISRSGFQVYNNFFKVLSEDSFGHQGKLVLMGLSFIQFFSQVWVVVWPLLHLHDI